MRKWLMLLLLWWVAPAWATTYYVSPAGAGAADGSSYTPTDNSMSFATMSTAMTAGGGAVAGDIYYLKGGTYTLGATTAWAIDGSATAPIKIVGCNSSWVEVVPARATASAAISTNTTDGSCPYLDGTGSNYYLNNGSADFLIYQGLRIAINRNGAGFNTGANCVIYGCAITNQYNGASASGINLGSNTTALDNDFASTASSSASACIVGGNCLLQFNRVYDSASYGIEIGASGSTISNNLVYGCANYGIYLSSGTASNFVNVINNTIYAGGVGKGFGTSSTAYTAQTRVISNWITDSTTYAIENPSGTGGPMVIAFNRSRDNTSEETSVAGDWDTYTTYQHVTNNDAPGDDWVDPANGDFRIKNTAHGAMAGVFGSIGAMQLPAATLPAVSDVWVGVTNWGYSWAWSTGTKRASSIMNCEAGNIKSGVTIDDVTGSYAGGGGSVIVIDD